MKALPPLLLAALLTLAGCREKPAATGADGPARAADQTYTVRAQITELPVAGNPRTTLRAHHEAIDNFVGKEGKIIGMGAMDMEFPPTRGLDLSEFKIGDVVEMTFAVWWDQGTPTWYATRLKKLPADTKLEFRPANPPSSPTPPKA